MSQNYHKPLLHWLARGVVGTVMATYAIAPASAIPYPSSEAYLTAQTSSVEPADPITIAGELDVNSPTLPNGSYYQEHTFEGTAREEIAIELNSDEFDTYLLLKSPDGRVIAENDDDISGTDSTVVMTLPIAGTYTAVVGAIGEAAVGSYQLEKRTATVTDQALAEAVQLNQQVTGLHQTSQYAEAIPLAERAIAIVEATLGESHPSVAPSLNNLASLYQAQDNYAEAEPIYQRALSISEAALGERHPVVATSLSNLALLVIAQLPSKRLAKVARRK